MRSWIYAVFGRTKERELLDFRLVIQFWAIFRHAQAKFSFYVILFTRRFQERNPAYSWEPPVLKHMFSLCQNRIAQDSLCVFFFFF